MGHGLDHDEEVLGLGFPADKVRDTAAYRPFHRKGGGPSQLKYLAEKHLNEKIQVSYHSRMICFENLVKT